PEASATASGSGKRRGSTRTRRARPIVRIARAEAPMLPGWLVATSTIRTAERRSRWAGIESTKGRSRRMCRLAGYNRCLFLPFRLPASGARHEATLRTMHPMLTIAVKAARRAGNIINRGARELDLLTVTSKGPKDFVSEVDREAERAIVEVLLGAFPDHA